MSDAKHTPGPWGIRPREAGREVTLLRPHWEVASIPLSGGPNGVAIAFGDDDANARLISAAPDLLEALIFMRRTMYSETSEESRRADAAIAKATGRWASAPSPG